MKDSFCYFIENAIFLHPCKVRFTPCLVNLQPRVPVTNPDRGLAPDDPLFVFVLVIAGKLELTTKPLLVRRKKTKTTIHIVKNSVLDVLAKIIHVEKATKISMVA